MDKKEFKNILIKASIDAYISWFWKIKNKNDKIMLNNFISKLKIKYINI